MQQQELISRAKEVFSQDSRVLGVWLAGGYAKGTYDQFSDIDLWPIVDPVDLAAFGEDWPRISDEIAPTVLRQQVGSLAIFNQVTPDGLRFDVLIGTPAEISERTISTVKPLYDPKGLSAGLSRPGRALPLDPGRVQALSLEFLRVPGLLPVVVGREEYVVGVSGVNLLRTVAAHVACADAFLPPGRALHERCALAWPQELEDAARRHLATALSVQLSA